MVTSNANPITIVLNLLELIQDEIIARKGLEHCGQPINLDATLMTSAAADYASLICPTCYPSAAARLAALRGRIFTMLPKEIEAIVIAVWRSDDDVCVEFRRLRIGQEHAGVVVELDKYHRALNPIVERTIVIGAADPAKMRCVEMPLDLAKAAVQRPLR